MHIRAHAELREVALWASVPIVCSGQTWRSLVMVVASMRNRALLDLFSDAHRNIVCPMCRTAGHVVPANPNRRSVFHSFARAMGRRHESWSTACSVADRRFACQRPGNGSRSRRAMSSIPGRARPRTRRVAHGLRRWVVDRDGGPKSGVRRQKARKLAAFRVVKADREALTKRLLAAPRVRTDAAAVLAAVITLPLPDGTFERFAVERVDLLAPRCAARFPDLHTFRAQGIDDPSASARLELSPFRFRAYLMRDGDDVVIDPVDDGDHYRVYRSATPQRAVHLRLARAGRVRRWTAASARHPEGASERQQPAHLSIRRCAHRRIHAVLRQPQLPARRSAGCPRRPPPPH